MWWIWLVVLLLDAVVMSLLGSWIAQQKYREASEGLILGLLFGPLGVLVEALLPTLTRADRAARVEESRRDDDPPPVFQIKADRPKEVPKAIDQIEL